MLEYSQKTTRDNCQRRTNEREHAKQQTHKQIHSIRLHLFAFARSPRTWMQEDRVLFAALPLHRFIHFMDLIVHTFG